MPIVTIQVVTSSNGDTYSATDVARLADHLGSIFNSEPGGTWVKLETLDRSLYAENEMELDSDIQPTFVEVLKRSLPDQDMLTTEAQEIAAAVSHTLSRPVENVHIIYLPSGEGRIAFGGKLLTKPESE